MIKFIRNHILSQFGILRALMLDNGDGDCGMSHDPVIAHTYNTKKIDLIYLIETNLHD